MPPLTPELIAAIESLYGAFQGYPLPASTGPCPCCHSAKDERPLYSKPLRKLTQEDLYRYAMDAVLVWGDADDFRHFLPRIFELTLLANDYSFADREIVFSKLYHAEWRYWPEKERKAVEEFFFVLWCAVLEAEPGDDPCQAGELESWLCALAQAETDLSPYLDAWLQCAREIHHLS